MKAGFGTQSIVPTYPVRLLTSPPIISNNVHTPTHAKAVVLEGSRKRLILVTLDLVYCHDDIYKQVQAQYKEQVIISATHAHSTPALTPSYREFVAARIHEAIESALLDLTDAAWFYGTARCNLNINRRLRILAFKNFLRLRFIKTFEVRPNPWGAVDHTIRVVQILRGQRLPIYLVNYPCHLTMWHKPSISADWVSYLDLDGPFLFLQGFSGDLIPYYAKAPTTLKDKIIAYVEGTNDFKKHGTTDADMRHAASMVRDSIERVQFLPVRGPGYCSNPA